MTRQQWQVANHDVSPDALEYLAGYCALEFIGMQLDSQLLVSIGDGP